MKIAHLLEIGNAKNLEFIIIFITIGIFFHSIIQID